MRVGYVIGESTPTSVAALTSRPLAVGEYVKIITDTDEILGLVESSSISSAALDGVRNFEEAIEGTEIAKLDSRDKSYNARIGVLGLLYDLQRGKSIIPATPPVPGTEITKPTVQDLDAMFNPVPTNWVKIGKLLRNNEINAKINLDKIVSRHLGILAMTGMGKSNLVSLIAKHISSLNGTVIIFDYHNDYTSLEIPRINIIAAKINPRLLEAEQFASVLEIRENATRQRNVIEKAFGNARSATDFWGYLETNIEAVIVSDDKRDRDLRSAAYRVLSIVEHAKTKFADILDPNTSNPLSFIKEGRANILNISELSEKQANVAVAFYLSQLLYDRKNASFARHDNSKQRDYRFASPIFVIIEEAHVFVPKDHDAEAKYWAAKIAREGRKFGLGLGIVSQRPRSVDLDVLSQMGSFAIMKIIQEDDQRQIASATESTSRELLSQLTSLNIGDAILIGQWSNLPSLVHIDQVKEKIAGADQSAVDAWTKAAKINEMATESTQGLIQKDLLLS